MFALAITSAAAARVAPAPTSASDRRARVATRASSPDSAESRAAGVPAAGHAVTRRGALFGAAAAALALGAPSPALAKRANKLADLSSLSPAEQEYADATLRLIAQTSALVEGADGAVDVEGWLAASSAWSGLAPSMYSPKSQGKSFLMTTKLVAYLRNSFATLPGGSASFDAANPPFDKSKTSEWVSYAEGFTTGTLSGDAARAAFARATWGNYDKSAPLNRFGLCAFGETGGTKALGVDCDGY